MYFIILKTTSGRGFVSYPKKEKLPIVCVRSAHEIHWLTLLCGTGILFYLNYFVFINILGSRCLYKIELQNVEQKSQNTLE